MTPPPDNATEGSHDGSRARRTRALGLVYLDDHQWGSGLLPQGAQLYRKAGVDLHADLNLLTRTANVTADSAAYRWMRETSTLTGRLDLPILTLHTTADALVPVQHEEEHAEDVHHSGSAALPRQAYADHAGHCAFATAELVAAVVTMERRIDTGRWNGPADPQLPHWTPKCPN